MDLIQGFVHPALAAGALLASVPLIIHLLNRQRHKPMPWAAMRFVQAAFRKTRRRARMENWLLLFLRMAAVALLAFAVARPFTQKESPLAELTEERRDLVLVLDASASTGYRRGVQSVFDLIVERARDVIGELSLARGDRVRLIAAGAFPRLLSWRSPEEASAVLGALREPFDEELDLAAALGEVARYVEESAVGGAASGIEVRLLTDLQARAFGPRIAGGSEAPQVLEVLDRLKKVEALVWVEDLGPSDATPPNVGVSTVEFPGQTLATDVPLEAGVGIANFGAEAVSAIKVTLEIDGERRPARLVDLEARGSARVNFPVQFRQRGWHSLVARIEADRLAVDDALASAIYVPPPIEVLLVDGEPSSEIEKDEVGFLAAVLAPLDDGSASSPFHARTIEPSALAAPEALLEADVIWLANVPSLSTETVERLSARVAAGAGLVVSLGSSVDTASYNHRLFVADGSGLLPGELGRRVAVGSRRDNYYRAKSFDVLHPALAFFADERWRPLFSEVPIYEFVALRAENRARVLAVLDDPDASPLLVEKSFDRGSVFLWTTTIDNAWTRLPESPRTLVPLVHELVRYAGRPRLSPRNIGVNDRIVLEVPFAPRTLSCVHPDGSRSTLSGEARSAGAGTWSLPPFGETLRAGLYRVESEGEAPQPFAVQLAPEEGDLLRTSRAELEALHPALRWASIANTSRSGEDPELARAGELWRALAIACFIALILETLWAAWIGRRRGARR